MAATTQFAPARALRRAAVVAAHATSVRNTQPWRIVIRASAIELHADPTRQLVAFDPSARQLYLSCGCALFNARVSLAADGVAADVDRIPDPARPTLVARLTLRSDGARTADAALAPLLPAVYRATAVRNGFTSAIIDATVMAQATEAALASQVDAVPVARERVASVIRLELDAEAADRGNPSVRAELRSTADGAVRLRALPEPVLAVLTTGSDDTEAWIRAGEGYQDMALRLAHHGYAAAPLPRVIEHADARAELSSSLALSGYPQLLVQIGRPRPCQPGRLRRLVNVLIEAE